MTGRSALAALATAALLAASPGAPAQDRPTEPAADRLAVEDLDPSAERAADLFARAERLFPTADQALSEALYSEVIRLLADDPRRDEPGAVRDRLLTSLARRAEVRFNLGEPGVENDLRRLLALAPGHRLERGRLSPKLLDLWDRLRAEVTGELELVVEPPDAGLLVDGAPVEPRDGAVHLAAGAHDLRLERPGYAPRALAVEVRAGRSERLEVSLERRGPALRLATRPGGAELAIGGSAVATTPEPPPPPGTAPPAVAAPEPGRRELTIAREGYRTRRLRLPLLEPRDYVLPTLELEPARGELVLTGVPSGARVRVDGRPVEVGADATVELELAPGPHRVAVSAGVGGVFHRNVEVLDRRRHGLPVVLRPGIVLLGVLGDDPLAARELDRRLAAGLAAGERFEVIEAGEDAAPVLDELGLDAAALRAARPPSGVAAADPGAADGSALRRRLDAEWGGSLYALGVLAPGPYAEGVALWLWAAAPGPARPAVVPAQGDGEAIAEELVRRLEAPLPLTGRWLGLDLVDSAAAGGPVVAHVAAGGPAEAAGLAAGDELLAVAGAPVASRREALAALQAWPPADGPVPLELWRAGVRIGLGLDPGRAALAPDGHARPVPYPVAWPLLARAEREGAAPPWLLDLRRARILLEAGEPGRAVELLRRLEAPPDGPVGRGSADYLLGLALSATGRDAEAASAFERAAASAARLGEPDGPPVAPRARARLGARE